MAPLNEPKNDVKYRRHSLLALLHASILVAMRAFRALHQARFKPCGNRYSRVRHARPYLRGGVVTGSTPSPEMLKKMFNCTKKNCAKRVLSLIHI